MYVGMSNGDGDDGSNTGIIVGISVLAIIVGILVAAVATCIIICKAYRQYKDRSKGI